MAINYAPLMAQLDLSPLRDTFNANRQFKLESERRDIEQQRVDYAVSKDQAELDRKAAFNTAYQEALLNPSQAKFDSLRATYPDFHEPIDAGWKSYSGRQQTDMLGTAGSFVAAINNGKPDLALHALQQRRTALAGSGVDTTETDALIKMVQSGDPVQIKAARGIGGMILAQAAGDKFDTVWARLNKVDNEEELQPERVRGAKADADYKETRASFAPAKEKATIARATATAADARSRQNKRDNPPARGSGGGARSSRPVLKPAGGSKPQVTATGPGGRKYVVKGGKWVPAS